MIDDDGRHAEADCLLNLLALFRRILTAFIDAQVPSAAPDVLTGIRIGLGVGWSVLVAAELIAATRGLGFMIQSARQFLETDVVIMGIIVIALPSLPAPTHARPASCASCTAPPTRCTCTRSRTSTWPSTRHSSRAKARLAPTAVRSAGGGHAQAAPGAMKHIACSNLA
jgi:hypothetical protein